MLLIRQKCTFTASFKKDLTAFGQFIAQLQRTTKNAKKLELIAGNKDTWGELLSTIIDEKIRFGIKTASLDGKEFQVDVDETFSSIKQLLSVLVEKKYSVNESRFIAHSFIESFPTKTTLAKSIIDKNLGISCNMTTLNKAFEKTSLAFTPELGFDFMRKRNSFAISDGWYASRKYDGIRAIVACENGQVTVTSRTDRKIKLGFPFIDHLKELNAVFDGELVCMNEDQDSFNTLSSLVGSHSDRGLDLTKVHFYVFDILAYNGSSLTNLDFGDRIAKLKEVLKESDLVKVVEQRLINTDEQLQAIIREKHEKGWEGVVIRLSAPNTGTRTKNFLKIKSFHDAEYKVEKAIIEQENGSPVLKSILLMHKDHPVHVGSGFTQEERLLYGKNPELLIDKMVTVKFFQESEDNSGSPSLRFPVFKFLHGNKRTE